MTAQSVQLRASDVAAVVRSDRWWELAALRQLLGGSTSATLGHDAGPDPRNPSYAFLAADVTANYRPALRTVRRYIILLRGNTLLNLDIAVGPGPVRWVLAGGSASLVHHRLLPEPGETAEEHHIFLNILAEAGTTVEPVISVDLAGARIGPTVALFHTETGMARSSVFFDVETVGKLHVLIAGLAPGPWDVWRDGFLEESGVIVRSTAGTLYFDGEPGNYFIRRR